MKIVVHPDLRETISYGVLRLEGVKQPADRGDALWKEMTEECTSIQECFKGLSSGKVPGVEEARKLYRAIGIDPTKTRPSSEALLRRVIKGKGLYRVNPLVDLFNCASLVSLLPVGLYDEHKISGSGIMLRLGDQGWGYEGINRGRINVASRLCLIDADGPFGSPTADSLRTSIDISTQNAVAIFFQPADGDRARMERALNTATDLSRSHLSAVIKERRIEAPGRDS